MHRVVLAQVFLAAVILLLSATPAFGCIGSRLIYMIGFQLLVFNLFIGLMEGTIGWLLSRLPFKRAVAVMILANYFSLIAAWPLMKLATEALTPLFFHGPRILYLRNLAWFTVGVSFVLTVAFEMPFCWYLFRKAKSKLFKAALFCVVSQAAIYSFLGPFMRDWVSVSFESLKVHSDTSSTRNPGAVVYYLATDNGGLWRMKLDGSGKEFVGHTSADDGRVPLYPVPNAETGGWRLIGGRTRKDSEKCMMEDFRAHDVEMLAEHEAVYEKAFHDFQCGRGQAFDFTNPQGDYAINPLVRVYSSGWGGVIYEMGDSKYASRDIAHVLKYQTPFDVFQWDAASVLPNDEAVLAVDGQVLLLDIRQETLAFLTEGRSPFVVPAVRSH